MTQSMLWWTVDALFEKCNFHPNNFKFCYVKKNSNEIKSTTILHGNMEMLQLKIFKNTKN